MSHTAKRYRSQNDAQLWLPTLKHTSLLAKHLVSAKGRWRTKHTDTDRATRMAKRPRSASWSTTLFGEIGPRAGDFRVSPFDLQFAVIAASVAVRGGGSTLELRTHGWSMRTGRCHCDDVITGLGCGCADVEVGWFRVDAHDALLAHSLDPGVGCRCQGLHNEKTCTLYRLWIKQLRDAYYTHGRECHEVCMALQRVGGMWRDAVVKDLVIAYL